MPRLFITTLLLFGALIIGFFYFGPEWQSFRSGRKAIQDLSRISSEFDEIANERDAFIELINTISAEDIERINTALPQGPHAADFLVFLERLSAENGVVLKSVDLASFTEEARSVSGQPTPGGTVLAPAPSKPIKEFPVTILVSGTYESFRTFLDKLEKNLRLIDADSISFSSQGNAKVIDFSLKAKTYYQ